MPKLSVVTVSFNSARTIEDALTSLHAQTFQDFEHIVVDGSSSDNTMDIVDQLKRDGDIAISEPDCGIYDAMNKGLKLASGEFIGFLNSDDFLAATTALETLVAHLERSGADCVWGDVVHVDHGGRPVRYMSGALFSPRLFPFALMPPHPTFYARREALVRAGGFNAKYQIAGDFELMVKLYKQEGFQGVYADTLITAMRMGGVSTDGVKATLISSKELRTALADNGIISSRALVALRYGLKIFEKVRGLSMSVLGARFAPPRSGRS